MRLAAANTIDTTRHRAPSRIFRGSSLGFSTGNTVLSAAGGILDFRPGKTLYLVLHTYAQATPASWETVVGAYDHGALRGWLLLRGGLDVVAGAGRLYLLTWNGGGPSVAQLGALPAAGVTHVTLVWRASDGVITQYHSGAFVSTFGGPTTPGAFPASAKVTLGSAPGGATVNALTTARIIAVAMTSSEATAAQVAIAAYTKGNRYRLASSVTTGSVFNYDTATHYSASGFTSGGSTPVTFIVTNSPTMRTIAERRYPASSVLHDGRLSIPTTDSAGIAWTIRNSNSRMVGTTSALSVGVEVASSHPDSTLGRWGQRVAGTFTELLRDSLGVWTKEAQLGTTETSRAFELISGVSMYDSGSATTRYATSLQALRVPLYLTDGTTSSASSVTLPSAPTTRVVLFGNSILDGFYVTAVAQDSITAQLRAAVDPGVAVSSLACGFESVSHVVGDLAEFVARLVAECDGTDANWIVLNLGTNDYGIPTTSAATFATNAATLVDAIHAALPDTDILWFAPFQRIAPSSEGANSFGDDLDDYRGHILALTSGRAWLTVVNGAAGAVISNGNMAADGLHIVTAGAAEIVAAIQSETGL